MNRWVHPVYSSASRWAPVYPAQEPLVIVGAVPAHGMPSLASGVDAIVDIGSSSKLRDSMGPVGSVVLWAGMRSVGEFAKGNAALASGAAAAAVLAGVTYYTAAMLAEQTTKVATATLKQAYELVADIPLLGLFADVAILIVTEGGSATAKPQAQRTAECQTQFRSIAWGTGPQGEVLPADIFMAAAVTEAERAKQLERDPTFMAAEDGLSPFAGTIRGQNGAGLTHLLLRLEVPPKPSADAEAAWPGAGLTSEERSVLRKLRLGMSATYKRPQYAGGKAFTSEPTDGGTSLWPLYIDILWHAWRQGRLPYGYLLWRSTYGLAPREDVYYAHASMLHATGKAYLVNNVPAGQVAVDKHYEDSDAGNTIPCTLLDNRSIVQFQKMLQGWDQLVDTRYSGFEKNQAADNPLHAPPSSVFANAVGRGGILRALLPVALIGAAAAGGLYYFRPALARSLYSRSVSLGSRGVSYGKKLITKVTS